MAFIFKVPGYKTRLKELMVLIKRYVLGDMALFQEVPQQGSKTKQTWGRKKKKKRRFPLQP